MDRLVASPCSAPDWTLPEVLAAHAELGFMKFEAFTSWVKSALDLTADPLTYVEAAGRYGMRYTSMHLPPVGDDFDESLAGAIRAARFARQLGAEVVLFKATSRRNYVRAAPVFAEGGMVSLQIEYTQENVGRLNDLVKDLRKALKKPPAIVPKAQADAQREQETSASAYRGFRGAVVASRDAEEFGSATPEDFKQDGRYDTSLFTLIASLSSMKRPVALLIEKNGDRVVFQFDAEGDIVRYEGPRSETVPVVHLEHAASSNV